ncbi:MAG: hypothetical protein KatS3mg051_1154 [Anaerolineae bacterium]|nr:MAG: hypothetical protein KatS3mg051_1154 [Anaerolineae bacterium]
MPAVQTGKTKKRTSLGITHECDRLMDELAARLGVSRNVVVELAVRELAKLHKIEINPVPRDREEE